MSLIQNTTRRLRPSLRQPLPQPSHHRYASRTHTAIHVPTNSFTNSSPTTAAFPITEKCPSPTCPCRSTPTTTTTGEKLEKIDTETGLEGSMAPYGVQVLISTGKRDWRSRIEDDDCEGGEDGGGGEGGSAAVGVLRLLKGALGRGGRFTDPFHNVLLTNSSIPPTPTPIPDATTATPSLTSSSSPNQTQTTTSAYLVPSFTYLPHIVPSPSSTTALIKSFILPPSLHPSHTTFSPTMTPAQKANLTRDTSQQAEYFPDARPVEEILVLICGHGGRDARCGVYGPVLLAEFEEKLSAQGIAVLTGAPPPTPLSSSSPSSSSSSSSSSPSQKEAEEQEQKIPSARVALISHIGGHKFAGNVIIYLPPRFRGNALKGKGVWYGRVEPRHVQGIVEETVLGGRIIREFFRGGVGMGGEILRL